jgi:hypothetical protein
MKPWKNGCWFDEEGAGGEGRAGREGEGLKVE